MYSRTYRTASEALPGLMDLVLNEGDEVGSRNGRTMEISPIHIELTEPWKREILVPGRKASLPAQIAETMWVLSGRDDIEWLSHYLPRAAEFSDDGKVWRGAYGPRLRRWVPRPKETADWGTIDQLAHVVELLKGDPLSRRAVINIYDPDIDSQPGKDIPCNNWLHFMNRLGKLDLHVTIRSNDLMWGWSGINAFEWSVLQEIVAKALGVQIGSLHFQISSLHLYENHWSKAAKIAEAESVHNAMPNPTFAPEAFTLEHFENLCTAWFKTEEMIRTGEPDWTKAIEQFYEPMMQQWLWVLAYHWTGNDFYLNRVSPALRVAATWSANSPVFSKEEQDWTFGKVQEPSEFVKYVSELHAEKHAAYGDSWKRRGEMLGIMANIARKVDRLGVNGAGDTATDTAIDLLVYLCKYRWWLYEFADAPSPTGARWDKPTDQVEPVTRLLEKTTPTARGQGIDSPTLEKDLEAFFKGLEIAVTNKEPDRWNMVDTMIAAAYTLANRLWQKDKNATQRFEGYNV